MAQTSGQTQLDLLKSKFIVVIPNISPSLAGVFETCSTIEATVNVFEKRVGGSLLSKKIPGNITIPPVTLTKGAIHQDFALFDYFKSIANMIDQRAILDSNLIYDQIDIIQTDRNARPLIRWKLYNAFPSKFSTGDFDSKADEVRVETLEICLEKFDRDTDVGGLDLISIATIPIN